MKRILVVQTGFIGDVILSTPIFQNLRVKYPQAEIIALTTPLSRELFEYHPAISETLVFDKRGAQRGFVGLLEMSKQLKQYQFDAVFSLHKSWRTALLLYLSNIPQRFGFREASAHWLYTRTTRRKDLSHEVLRNLAILRCVGLEPIDAEQKLFVQLSESARQAADKYLAAVRSKPLVGLAPGSVWPTKRWPGEYFSELGQSLKQQGYQLVLLGGPADAEIGTEVAAALGPDTLNLIGQTSLLESAAVIQQLSVLVSNDSAPLHLASALGVSSVALFCATVPEFGFGPWQNEHRVLGVEGLSCRPCGRHGGKTCPTGTHACQLELKPQVVELATCELAAARQERKQF